MTLFILLYIFPGCITYFNMKWAYSTTTKNNHRVWTNDEMLKAIGLGLIPMFNIITAVLLTIFYLSQITEDWRNQKSKY